MRSLKTGQAEYRTRLAETEMKVGFRGAAEYYLDEHMDDATGRKYSPAYHP